MCMDVVARSVQVLKGFAHTAYNCYRANLADAYDLVHNIFHIPLDKNDYESVKGYANRSPDEIRCKLKFK